MSVALAVWSVAVAPGEKESVITPHGLEIRITNVALGASLDDEQGRTSVKFTYDSVPKPEDLDSDAGSFNGEKVTTVLCSLTPGKIEQATIDLVLDSNEEFIFEVVGKNTVYLTGNYIQQGSGSDSDSDNEGEDEEAFNLEDVSSDVEVDPAELDELDDDDTGRFEELVNEDEGEKEAVHKGKKRPAEGMDVDDEAPSEGKLTKAQKKALKKQKGENGQAVHPATPEAKGDGEKKKEKKDKKKEDGAVASTTELKELAGGVQYRDVTVGNGPNAKKGATIKMRYIGKLTDGTVFDKNTTGKPFAFRLGAGEVIKGWDVGVVGMKVGGERELIIPPEMAYGKRKSGPIPASSTLRFEVKLIGVS